MRQIPLVILIVLISCNEIVQPKSEPVVIETPHSEATNFETNDSSFLKIEFQNENYKISFLNENLSVYNVRDLDSFLHKNIQLINRDKVIVTGFNIEKDKNLVDILSKYGISKFRVNTL